MGQPGRLHDFDEEDLRSFYFDACGFVPTIGGLIALFDD